MLRHSSADIVRQLQRILDVHGGEGEALLDSLVLLGVLLAELIGRVDAGILQAEDVLGAEAERDVGEERLKKQQY